MAAALADARTAALVRHRGRPAVPWVCRIGDEWVVLAAVRLGARATHPATAHDFLLAAGRDCLWPSAGPALRDVPALPYARARHQALPLQAVPQKVACLQEPGAELLVLPIEGLRAQGLAQQVSRRQAHQPARE